jgi:O-antigen/teichoic acid export membrane protein
MQHHDTAQTVADIASRAQYTGSLLAGVGAFLNEYAAAIGVLIAVVGFLVNWCYRHKIYKLEKAKYAKEGIVEEE